MNDPRKIHCFIWSCNGHTYWRSRRLDGQLGGGNWKPGQMHHHFMTITEYQTTSRYSKRGCRVCPVIVWSVAPGPLAIPRVVEPRVRPKECHE